MDTRGYQQYKQQSISTMTPEELLLLVYDELVKRLLRADLALEQQDYVLFDASVERSLDIVHYLEDTLDKQYPISNELGRLYEFFCFELARIKSGRNKVELEKIKPMILELRDSFRTAAKNCASSK